VTPAIEAFLSAAKSGYRGHGAPRRPEYEESRPKPRISRSATLRIDDASDLQRRCPEQYSALIECSAFVNYRQAAGGRQPVLALMLIGGL
jgi:hypothetical protein